MATHHVIIGGGPAATNAAETIRQIEDGESKITLICDEPAHSRMALPYWLAGQIPREQTHTADDGWFRELDINSRIGTRVQAIDTASNSVALSDGDSLTYDNLLIATGSRPLGLPVEGADLPGVQPMWTLEHAATALQTVDSNNGPRVVLIGAGFIGFIVLNAMEKRGWQLTVVEREPHFLPRMLNGDAAEFVETWLGERNVQQYRGTSVTAIRPCSDGSNELELSNGATLVADLVVVATGVQPNLDLVDGTAINTDVGIIVNDRLQTSVDGIYAAGDVAQGPTLLSDQLHVHGIQTTAVDHGRVAGANMAGEEVHYPGSLSMNVLDVCGLQCVSYGNWEDTSAEPMTISSPATRVYRQLLWTDDQITGAILVGRAGDVGMLTDVGMIKGLMQTQKQLGPWKQFLADNPFDVRRAYVASGVAAELSQTTLTGRPARARRYRYGNSPVVNKPGRHHAHLVGTKQ